MRHLLLSILLLLLHGISRAQTDRIFWFAVPDVSSFISNGGPGDRPIQLRLTTGIFGATVQVSVPANPAFIPINQTIPPNTTQTIDLTTWIAQLETSPANQVLNNGLLITSDVPITAYYEVVSASCGNCNPEIFVLKGDNALGTDFYVPLQNIAGNNTAYNPTPTNSFDIVATENNTIVQITPSRSIVGHPANSTFTIILNRGQTYSATATGSLAADHLAGSRIIADKPVAVTMKDDLITAAAYGTCADLGGDQIIPISKTGTTYIAVKGFLTSPFDKLFIVATENNTSIAIDGAVVTTLLAGQSYMHTLSSNTAFVTSSSPIYISQLSGHGCEMGLGSLPPIECTGSQQISFARGNAEALYLMLLVKSGYETAFTVNGNATVISAADFSVVPFSGNQWLYARKQIGIATIPSGGVMRIENSQGLFHAGIINGSDLWGSRFGFFSDFNDLRVIANADQAVCLGQDILLGANSVTGATYTWTGPSGFSSTQQNPVITGSATQHAGMYYVTASFNGCTALDSIEVSLSDYPVMSMPDTIRNCGEPVLVSAGTGFASYLWSTGLTTHDLIVTQPGKYYVTVTNAAGCATTDSVFVEMTIVDVAAQSDAAICVGSDILLNASQVAGASYQWTGPAGFNSSQQNPTIVAAGVQHAGLYYVTASLNGCTDQASVQIEVATFPVVNMLDTIFTCGEPATIDAGPGFSSYQWSTGETTRTITTASPGEYYVTVSNATGCSTSDSVYINIEEIDVFIQPGTNILCVGSTITLNATGTGSGNYQWYWNNVAITGGVSPQLLVSEPGQYSVEMQSTVGCNDQDNISIQLQPKPSLVGPPDIPMCIGETTQFQIQSGDSHEWSPSTYLNNPSISNPVAVPLQSIDYTVRVMDAVCGYDTNIVVRVNVNPLPTVTITKSSDLDCAHAFVQLNASGGQQYLWSPSSGLSNPNIPNPIITGLTTTTTYSVLATNSLGCENTASVTINVINTGNPVVYMPTAFTPNGDGKNDCFKIAGSLNGELLGFSIYNRWGERVFHTTNPNDCWDGIYKGVRQDTGVFVYMVRAKTICGEVFSKGYVTIIR